jgi:hypothetical protein
LIIYFSDTNKHKAAREEMAKNAKDASQLNHSEQLNLSVWIAFQNLIKLN